MMQDDEGSCRITLTWMPMHDYAGICIMLDYVGMREGHKAGEHKSINYGPARITALTVGYQLVTMITQGTGTRAELGKTHAIHRDNRKGHMPSGDLL
jgi:hypothetical protein